MIRRRRDELSANPAVRMREGSSSDWVKVRLTQAEDVDVIVALAAAVLADG